MKKTLVIGSTVIDILISLPRLPQSGEDVNIDFPLYRLGGCAYNVYRILRLFESPALLCSPVGSGVYGRMARENLEAEGIKPFVNIEEENGCCYCLIEPGGERSFLACHGAEYLFSRSWMKTIDISEADGVYISGIEVEDSSGGEIVDFVCGEPLLELYFSPGPRIERIDSSRMKRILSRRDDKGKGPFLHLNEREAILFSGEKTVPAAACFLGRKTCNDLVITLGEKGCYCYESGPSPRGSFVPGFPKEKVLDTTGAGDAHCGAVIALRKQGKPLPAACEEANRIGAEVTGVRGASLDKLPAPGGKPNI